VDKPVNPNHAPGAGVSLDKFRYFQRITLPVELSNRLPEFVLSSCRRHCNDLIRAERLTNLFGIHHDRRIRVEGVNIRNRPVARDVESDERSIEPPPRCNLIFFRRVSFLRVAEV
jgi:hypothetical protein